MVSSVVNNSVLIVHINVLLLGILTVWKHFMYTYRSYFTVMVIGLLVS
jgi:hypothetical protein